MKKQKMQQEPQAPRPMTKAEMSRHRLQFGVNTVLEGLEERINQTATKLWRVENSVELRDASIPALYQFQKLRANCLIALGSANMLMSSLLSSSVHVTKDLIEAIGMAEDRLYLASESLWYFLCEHLLPEDIRTHKIFELMNSCPRSFSSHTLAIIAETGTTDLQLRHDEPSAWENTLTLVTDSGTQATPMVATEEAND